MTLQVSYMGTKREIAPLVAGLVADAPEGPLLDLFCGICTIGTAIAPTREIWCNDAQFFAAAIAKAFFASRSLPPQFETAADSAYVYYRHNKEALELRTERYLYQEDSALQGADIEVLSRLYVTIPTTTISVDAEIERSTMVHCRHAFPYRLFTITYAGSYLGLRQAIEIDSIRYAIDSLYRLSTIDKDTRRWMCLALCQALCKVSTTTGHFAQPLFPKISNARRFIVTRCRSAWSEWLRALNSLTPFGSASWRQRNRTFCGDALQLLSHLASEGARPAVVYADPPYTKDQYSRYYHMYETLLYYDYPKVSGIGRCRSDRFVSRFSLPREAMAAFDELINASAQLEAMFILTYPVGGLMRDSVSHIPSMLQKRFSTHRVVQFVPRLHSSMGGSKGIEKCPAQEVLYVAH
jgi:adenine-specific DNA-methyltransferase